MGLLFGCQLPAKWLRLRINLGPSIGHRIDKQLVRSSRVPILNDAPQASCKDDDDDDDDEARQIKTKFNYFSFPLLTMTTTTLAMVQLQSIYSCVCLVMIVIHLAPSFSRQSPPSSPFSTTVSTTHAKIRRPLPRYPSIVHHWRYAVRLPVPPIRKNATSTKKTKPGTCSRTDCHVDG